MLVLVIDTAGSVGEVLLARNNCAASDRHETEVLGEGRLEPREFSRQLISAIAEMLRVNRLTLSDLDAFAVISGPGSFTGLRVGLSAVKAMAEVAAKPIIAISRLAVMASAADAFSTPEQAVHAVLDAGRGEFYHGIYRGGGRICIAESLQTQTALMVNFKSLPVLVVASEAIVLDAIGTLSGVTLQQIPAVTALAALPLVRTAWQARCFTDVSLLDANYLRRLDAEGVSKTHFADAPAEGS